MRSCLVLVSPCTWNFYCGQHRLQGCVQLREALPMVTHVVPPLAPLPPIPPHFWSRPSLLLHTRPLSLVTQRTHLFSMNTHFFHDPYIDRQTAEQTRFRVPSSVPITLWDVSKHQAQPATPNTDKFWRSRPGSRGQGRASKSFHMNNFGSRHLFSCSFSVTDPRQGLNKIGYKDLDLLKRDNVNSTAALISRNGRLLNKQRDKAMFAWLHTLAKKRRHAS